jgi:energy-coupling factor transport system permease protein
MQPSPPPPDSPKSRSGIDRRFAPFEQWTTREIVVGAVLAVVVGVIFWAWDSLYTSFFGAIPFPAVYAINGMWMLGGLLVPYVIRRPGAAFFGELVAAFVSMAIGNQWGVLVLASGVVQGAGAELGFACFRWKKFTWLPLYLAAALAQIFGIVLDTFVYSYYATYSWANILVAGIIAVVSAIVIGGGLTQVLGEALARTGALSGLGIGSGRAKRV